METNRQEAERILAERFGKDQVIALALADKAPEEAADTDTSTDVENSVEAVEVQE